MSHFRSLACFLFAVLPMTTATASEAALSGESWWSRVQILAGDNMEGRNTGSEGYRKAAAYVAGEFERLGLKAAGTKGYFQPIQFGVRQIREEQSSLELVRTGEVQALDLGDDANFGLPANLAEQVDARRCSSATAW